MLAIQSWQPVDTFQCVRLTAALVSPAKFQFSPALRPVILGAYLSPQGHLAAVEALCALALAKGLQGMQTRSLCEAEALGLALEGRSACAQRLALVVAAAQELWLEEV